MHVLLVSCLFCFYNANAKSEVGHVEAVMSSENHITIQARKEVRMRRAPKVLTNPVTRSLTPPDTYVDHKHKTHAHVDHVVTPSASGHPKLNDLHAARQARPWMDTYRGLSLLKMTNSVLLVVGVSIIAKWVMWRRDLLSKSFCGVNSQLQRILFVLYVSLSCTHMFLQRNAGKTGYSMISATVLVYLAKFLFAVVMFLRSGAPKVQSIFSAAGGRFGRLPVVILPMIPGCCFAAYDALSFMSISALDPVTYQVAMHARLVLLVITWQFTFQRRLSSTQWLAMVLLFFASFSKGIDKLSTSVGIKNGLMILLVQICLAVIGTVSSEVLLKELPVSTDLVNACMYCEGLLALIVGILVGVPGAHGLAGTARIASPFSEILSADAWEKLRQDPWMIASIICLSVFGIVTAYFLREFSSLFKELGACFVIIVSAVLEWFVLGMSDCTNLGLQACALAVLSLGVYNMDPIANRGASNEEKKETT